MLAQLDRVERELRRLGWWTDDSEPPHPPENGTLFSGLSFPHWLQFEFLPHARSAAQTDELPTSSQVGLMAMRQYDFHSTVSEALPLMGMLQEFDRLFERARSGIR